MSDRDNRGEAPRKAQLPVPPDEPTGPAPGRPVPPPTPGPTQPPPDIEPPLPGEHIPPAGDPPAEEPVRMTPKEVGGPAGPEPTRYGDWERKGRVSDF
ncbi:DUF1674 domain-containing protein [Falsiroseomonas sp. HW251]|uniref:DUF1674 domain-containing protein n=1 Tax=Falsiroseomonas sp. HW251 TaxID=3390998 RepID=UPI003D323D60